METSRPPQKFRGVFCFHCSRPILIAPSIVRREISFNRSGSDATQDWSSRVFSRRCKTCGREAIYTLSHVVDFEDESAA